ncbi:oligosaccharide flippase family protein [Deinococcus ficus]|uniref:Flippase n=1 Tax=Deinococcus ficus TaxID=317577 RepID=A0A221SZI4_9DEIO|nr:oligosaccharide flippase family protein [Deinococcus ficus]ASN82031.1 hypothetical protein DFI_05255 [Deinococcus ficus]
MSSIVPRIPSKYNVLLLFCAQGAKFLALAISLILLPTFDTSTWGQYIFIQSLSIWLSLIIEYGFNIANVGRIARVSKDELSFECRLALAESFAGRSIIFLVLLIAIVAFTPVIELKMQISLNTLLFVLMAAAGIGTMPTWFFQFTDRIYVIALAEVASAILSIACLFLLAHQTINILNWSAATAMIAIVISLIVNFIAIKEVTWHTVPLRHSFCILKKSFTYFVYNSSVGIYNAGTTVLVGSLYGISLSGAYGVADRITRLINSIISPIIKVYFPKFTLLYISNKRLYYMQLSNVLLISIICFYFISLLLFLFFPLLVRNFNIATTELIEMGQVLSVAIFFVNMSTIISFFWILPTKRSIHFNYITLSAAFINTCGILILKYFDIDNIAYSVLTSEIFVLLALILLLHKGRKEK